MLVCSGGRGWDGLYIIWVVIHLVLLPAWRVYCGPRSRSEVAHRSDLIGGVGGGFCYCGDDGGYCFCCGGGGVVVVKMMRRWYRYRRWWFCFAMMFVVRKVRSRSGYGYISPFCC